MYIVLLLLILLCVYLIMRQSPKGVEVISFDSKMPYSSNYLDFPTHSGIHDDYRYNPDITLKDNSYANYDIRRDVGLYRIYNPLCEDDPPRDLGTNIDGVCIKEHMLKTGSVQDSFEKCSEKTTVGAYNCLSAKN